RGELDGEREADGAAGVALGFEQPEGVHRLERGDGAGERADEADDRKRAETDRLGGFEEEPGAERAAEEPERRLREEDDVLTEGADEAADRRRRAGEDAPDGPHQRTWRRGRLGGLGH